MAACITVVGGSIGLAAFPAAAATTPPTASTPDVVDLGITDVLALLQSGQTTSEVLVQEYLDRISAYDNAYGDQPGLNAIVAVNAAALDEAKELDAERTAGTIRGPLHGVPILVKDNYATSEMPTSAGNASLATYQTDFDSTGVQRLRDAGAIIIAKTNMSEFAWSAGNSISSVRGTVHNPYDQRMSSSGSSGGTGASVAASFGPGGLGTDSCGSILGPSVHQSLVGYRPTMGLTSVKGIVPLSLRQDVSGPIGKTVADDALLLEVLAGYDPADPQTVIAQGQDTTHFVESLSDTALQGKRIAVANWDWPNVSGGKVPGSPETIALYQQAVADLEAQGATVVDAPFTYSFYRSLASGGWLDTRANLDDFFAKTPATWPEGLAELTAPTDQLSWSDIAADNKFSTTLSTGKADDISNQADIPNPAYDAAGEAQQAGRVAIDKFFADYDLDALALPTTSAPTNEDVGSNQFCGLGANTGIPTMTIPAGFTSGGLPAGLELAGPRNSDAQLLAMGYDYEQATLHRVPPTSTPELAHPAPVIPETPTTDQGASAAPAAAGDGQRLANTGAVAPWGWIVSAAGLFVAGIGSIVLRNVRRRATSRRSA